MPRSVVLICAILGVLLFVTAAASWRRWGTPTVPWSNLGKVNQTENYTLPIAPVLGSLTALVSKFPSAPMPTPASTSDPPKADKDRHHVKLQQHKMANSSASRSCAPCPNVTGLSINSSQSPNCSLDIVLKALKAKQELLRTVSVGDQVVMYELQQRTYFAKWSGSTLTVLGALWAPGLPYLELLTFHRFQQMGIRLAQCVSIRPLVIPLLHLPSGAVVPCEAWWPSQRHMAKRMRPVSARGGQPIITSVRYYCPISTCEGQCLGSQNSFAVTFESPRVKGEGPNKVQLQMVRNEQPFVLVTACSQPLWGYPRMKGMYPNILDEWLAFMKLKGFGDVNVYELWTKELEKDLQIWQDLKFVKYFRPWARGKWIKDSHRFVYCTQSAAHDHCTFSNQLHSRWVMMVHGPDLYPCANCTNVSDALAVYDHHHNHTLRVVRQDCGGDRKPGTDSLILSFDACTQPDDVHATPLFHPLTVLATFVHNALVSLPVRMHFDEVPVPSSRITSVHFYDAFQAVHPSEKGQLYVDNLRPKNRPVFATHTTIANVHAEVKALVTKVRKRAATT